MVTCLATISYVYMQLHSTCLYWQQVLTGFEFYIVTRSYSSRLFLYMHSWKNLVSSVCEEGSIRLH